MASAHPPAPRSGRWIGMVPPRGTGVSGWTPCAGSALISGSRRPFPVRRLVPPTRSVSAMAVGRPVWIVSLSVARRLPAIGHRGVPQPSHPAQTLGPMGSLIAAFFSTPAFRPPRALRRRSSHSQLQRREWGLRRCRSTAIVVNGRRAEGRSRLGGRWVLSVSADRAGVMEAVALCASAS